MDRSDEARERREEEETPARDGGTLGIADANPPRDRVPAREDKGALRETDEPEAGAREVQRTPGATGIDMGAGGTGTDLERD